MSNLQNTARVSENSEKKLSFKQRMMIEREHAVVDTVYHFLSTKGYESMTVDEVANTVGIAKASLYRHFPSKEALAVAAMNRAMKRAVEFVQALDAEQNEPIELLKQTVFWAMDLKLRGEMPNLPNKDSVLREHLMNSPEYMDGLMRVSDTLGEWIQDAQDKRQLNPTLPPLVILYTLYARSCDPVLDFLQQSRLYSHEDILKHVMSTCFEGLAERVTL